MVYAELPGIRENPFTLIRIFKDIFENKPPQSEEIIYGDKHLT